MTRLDSVDVRILEALQRDGRCTNAVLAARVGMSESACSQRLRRLETAGAIRGYRALVNESFVAPHVVILAQVKLEAAVSAQLAAFERVVAAVPEVVECHLVTGEFDYLLRIVAADMATYLRIADHAAHELKSIRTWVTNVVLRCAKDEPVPISRLRRNDR